MLALGAPIIILSALWKIIVASLVAGAGVAIMFGFVVLGLERAQRPDSSAAARMLNYAITGLAGTFCILAVVVGVYAMTQK